MQRYAHLICTDCDGTFANSAHQANPDLQPYLDALIQANVGIALVSARMPDALATFFSTLKFTGPVVAYSGALTLDHEGNTLHSQQIAPIQTMHLLQVLNNIHSQLTLNFYSQNMWWAPLESAHVQREEKIVHVRAHNLEASHLENPPSLHKILLMGDAHESARVEHELRTYIDDLTITRSSEILLEIMQKGVNKARAVRELLAHYELSYDRALIFGDGINDLEMIQEFPHSFAVANAHETVKARAKHLCAYSCDEAAVGRVSCEFLGIKVDKN